jgi:AcrR family transcriptional regulator
MAGPADRRELILASAAEMFARKGIGATTVREIADAVGVLSGSLYHHFDSKDAIVAEILGSYLASIRARYAEVLDSAKSAPERLHDLVLASLRVARDQPDATAIYQNELHYLREEPRFADIHAAASDIQHTWLQVIEKGVADGSFRGDIAPRVFYRLVRDAVWLSVRWHHPSRAYPTERLAADVTSIFLDGFAAQRQTGRVRNRAAPRRAART